MLEFFEADLKGKETFLHGDLICRYIQYTVWIYIWHLCRWFIQKT